MGLLMGFMIYVRWGVPFYEASAKLSANEDVFAALVRAHLKQKPEKKDKKSVCVLL